MPRSDILEDFYDNSNSGLTATTKQAALDELSNSYLNISNEVTGNATAVIGKVLLVNVSSGPSVITPPSNPESLNVFAISDSRANSSINTITIAFNSAGQNIHGASQDYLIDIDATFIEFLYINSTIGWITK